MPSLRTSTTSVRAQGDGRTDDTAALSAAINSGANTILLEAKTYLCGGLQIPSNCTLQGAGQGQTILKLLPNAGQPLIRNADSHQGNREIALLDLSVDGNAADQRAITNGILLDRVIAGHFEIEVTNCHGSGMVVSGGGNHNFGPKMYVHANGYRTAGYGLYLFCSDENIVLGGRYNDNCIGIAVEASGEGRHARYNEIRGSQCIGNRADFGQSGAGVHFEATNGADCTGGRIIGADCIGSTGVGINNTGTDLTIIGGLCADNRESAVTTIAARGFIYMSMLLQSNAVGRSTGYRAELRFDDTGLVPASKGRVSNCTLRGSAPDGGIRTMARGSAISFVDNEVSGYRFPYILSGDGDRIILAGRRVIL